MAYADNTQSILTDRIKEAGLRLTMARRSICRVLAESEDEFMTAGTIHSRVVSSAGGIDASTVYRTLEELGRLGLVHHVHLGGNRPGTWHLTLDHDHQHLVCEHCWRTIVVPEVELAPLYDVLGRRHGFRPTSHHFAILGLCSECQPVADHPHD